MLVVCEIADKGINALRSSATFLVGQEPIEPASLHQRNTSSSLCVLTAFSCRLHSGSPGELAVKVFGEDLNLSVNLKVLWYWIPRSVISKEEPGNFVSFRRDYFSV